MHTIVLGEEACELMPEREGLVREIVNPVVYGLLLIAYSKGYHRPAAKRYRSRNHGSVGRS
jgi:hypothetical protein